MFTSKLSVLSTAVVSLALFVGGCASQTTESAATSDNALEATVQNEFTPGSFNLYNEPAAVRDAACDVHTVLTLTEVDGNKAHASLRQVVTGVCYIYVIPDAREYDLTFEMNRCGSETFSGETTVNGQTRHIAITDNRARLCEDKQVAAIVVDEYDQTGSVTTRYSADGSKK